VLISLPILLRVYYDLSSARSTTCSGFVVQQIYTKTKQWSLGFVLIRAGNEMTRNERLVQRWIADVLIAIWATIRLARTAEHRRFASVWSNGRCLEQPLADCRPATERIV